MLDYTDCVGLNGKVISVSGFAGISGPLKNLSRILDVLCGKLSVVGPKLVESGDAALIEDGAMERFSVRPGLVSPLAVSGGEQLIYEEMFAADVRYIKRREMFMDFGILICAAVKGIRGDGKKYRNNGRGRYNGAQLRRRSLQKKLNQSLKICDGQTFAYFFLVFKAG